VLDVGQHVGNYEILGELGGGGFARVFRARHRFLDSEHAIKVLLPEHVGRPELRARFLDEARVQALLRHPHIVRVTDVLIEPGVAGIVMDFVPGGNLADWLDAQDAPPSPARLRELLVPVLDAVGHAHRRGVVHRDLKPENVLVGADDARPQVMDFGVAKVQGEFKDRRGSVRTTAAHAQIGTLAYMSPEQVRDAAAVDHRSDIFALGALLLELLTLSSPFDRGNDYDTMHAIVSGTYSIPDDVTTRDPRAATAARRALLLDPADRFASCAEFAAALGEIGAAKGGIGAEAPATAAPDEITVRRTAPAPRSSATTHSRLAPVAVASLTPQHRDLPPPPSLAPALEGTRACPPTPEHRQEVTRLRAPIAVGDHRLCDQVTRGLREGGRTADRAAVVLREAALDVLTPVSAGPALGLWSPHPGRRESHVSLVLLPGKESAARRLVFQRRRDQLLLFEEWWVPEVHLRGAWSMWLELRWSETQSASTQRQLVDLMLAQLGEPRTTAGPFPLFPRRQLLDRRALDITNLRPIPVGGRELAKALRPWLEPRVREAARYVAAVSLRAALLEAIELPGAGPALDVRAEPGDSVSLWLLPGATTGPRRFSLRYVRKEQLALTAEWRSLDSRDGPRPSVHLPAAPERTHAALEAHAVWRDRVLDELEATGTSAVGGIYPI